MSLLDIQRRYRELGRLRMGEQVTKTVNGKQKTFPAKLDTWRLTSPSKDLLERAAEVWGGTAEVWPEAPTQGEQYELTTEASRLEVYVPPQDLERSQYMELWLAGGVKRRCDLVTELISGKPCVCDPDKRECTVTTHLQVILPQIPDLGVWRMTTRGWNAAAELPETVDMLRKVHGEGAIPAAILEIEQRSKVSNGQTKHFVVPILRLPYSILEARSQGVDLLPAGKPPLGDRPELPSDARFSESGAQWGAPPALPGESSSDEVGAASEDSEPARSETGEGSVAREGHAPTPDPEEGGPSEVETPASGATPEQFDRLIRLYETKVKMLRAAGVSKQSEITFAKAEELILAKASA